MHIEDDNTQRTVSMIECQAYEEWKVLTERVERRVPHSRIMKEKPWYN